MASIRRFALVGLFTLLATSYSLAEDWPTYRYNNERTGATPEQLQLPLKQAWVYTAPAKPHLAWAGPEDRVVEGKLLKHRTNYDDCFHVAVVGKKLFFGSSVDHQVRCMDLASGKEAWTFFTGGPVRLAPTIWEDQVYFGSDDGYAYCLEAETGKLVWKTRAGPEEDYLLARGEMISRWPVRTGITIFDDVAYFGAGIFPHEDIFLYAVDAKTGKVLWKLDHISEEGAGRNTLSPQGYLLVNASYLFVPSGRALPVCFERKTGKLLHQRTHSWRGDAGGVVGGTQALLADGWIYANGEHHLVAMDQKTGNVGLGYFDGRQMAIAGNAAFTANGKAISKLDRLNYAKVTVLRQEMKNTLSSLTKQLTKGGQDIAGKIAKLMKDMAAIEGKGIVWTTPLKSDSSLIVAGKHIYVGGDKRIDALDAEKGKILWTEKIDGEARGLAVANGHLIVSTTTGKVYVFADAGQPKTDPVAQPEPVKQPFAKDELTSLYETAVDDILKQTKITKGFCLVIGAEQGRLAYELAKRSELKIYGIEPDAKKAEAARKVLSDAGLYGHRVVIHQADLGDIPYASYFANLVVSDSFVQTGKLPINPKNYAYHVKPIGGVVYLGRPVNAPGNGASAKELKGWLEELATDAPGKIDIPSQAGAWERVMFTRGKLVGAANWTHQYGDPGNTASSSDHLVKGGLGVLWYGDPGPGKMVNRHDGAVGPLSVNGRLIVQGEFSVMAYDAYNGMFLWEHENPKTYRTGVFQNSNASNLIASDKSVFVMEGTKVVEIDAASGKLVRTHLLPEEKQKEYEWGYLAHQDGILFGTATVRKELASFLKRRGKKFEDMTDAIFAIDLKTGKKLWTYEGKNVEAQTIALGPNRVFFVERSITMEQREAIMLKEQEKLKNLKGEEAKLAEKRIKKLDVRMTVALDAKTGKKLWDVPVDVTDCSKVGIGGGELTLIYSQDVLLLCGANANGHYWKQFIDGEFKIRRLVTLSAKDGKLLWAKDANYRHRPIIVGSKIIAEPWAFDLLTGKQIMRQNPITGKEEPWSIIRPGHHCGMLVGCPNMLLFRSLSTGFYDLYHDSGTQHFAGHRLGCWINAIPANGLVMIPEASNGCVCQFSIESTITLAPRKAKHPWTIYSSTGKTLPVEHLSLNLGAPGDRKDGHDKIWLAYPRPKPERATGLDLKLAFKEQFSPGGKFHSVSGLSAKVTTLDTPEWVYTSWAQGLKELKVPLLGTKDAPATYTVRLYFADVDKDAKPGQRVFDVKLQGKTVLKNFDPVAARKDKQTGVVQEIHGIEVSRDLLLELVPATNSVAPANLPILNAVEVIREKQP